jgi:DNA-binding transcriptional ArsR family regulator
MRELNLRESFLGTGVGKMRVELDKKALFALASDTRLEILRALEPTRRTVSQLAEAINIDKAAIHRHLKKLEEGGFVKRYEDHGFVYYGLSWKARDILAPNENTKVIIVLSCSWLLILGALAFAALGLSAQTYSRSGEMGQGNPTGMYQDLFAPDGSWPLWVIPTIILAVVAVILVIFALRRVRRPKQYSPVPEREPMESP